KALRDLDLLRTPKTEDTLQVPVAPRGAVQRCYVLRKAFEEWEPPPRYARPAQPTLIQQRPLDPTALPSSEPALSDLLSQGTALALQRGISVLSASFDPADRSMAHLLKAQQTLINTMLNIKLRVDEDTLRSQREESHNKILAKIIQGIKEAEAIRK